MAARWLSVIRPAPARGSSARPFDGAATRLFERVVFPVVDTLESRLARPPMGHSLLAIARAGAGLPAANHQMRTR